MPLLYGPSLGAPGAPTGGCCTVVLGTGSSCAHSIHNRDRVGGPGAPAEEYTVSALAQNGTLWPGRERICNSWKINADTRHISEGCWPPADKCHVASWHHSPGGPIMAKALNRCFHNREYGQPVGHHPLTVHFPLTAPGTPYWMLLGLCSYVRGSFLGVNHVCRALKTAAPSGYRGGRARGAAWCWNFSHSIAFSGKALSTSRLS
jgi:hypothetical protein